MQPARPPPLLDPTVRRFGSAPKADEGTTDAEIEIRTEHANSLDWTKATKVGVSSDGAMGGVVFATVDGVPYVLKPGEGSPANALFAEEVLQVVGGAQHTETAPAAEGLERLQVGRAAGARQGEGQERSEERTDGCSR